MKLEDILLVAPYITPRERSVLRLRFEKMTLQEIAEKFDVSRERIRQIERKALRKARMNGVDIVIPRGKRKSK